MARGHDAPHTQERLLAAYALAVDSGHIEELVGLFEEEATLTVHGGETFRGRRAIRQYFTRSFASRPSQDNRHGPLHHHVSPASIRSISATGASATSRFVGYTPAGADHWGTYRDRLVAIQPGRWRFASREVQLLGVDPDGWIGSGAGPVRFDGSTTAKQGGERPHPNAQPRKRHEPGALTAGAWLVAGGSSGLGLALVRRLLEDGATVVATGRQLAELRKLEQSHHGRLTVLRMDLLDSTSVRTAVARAFSEVSNIHRVISAAGVGLFGAVEECSEEQIKRVLEVNLLGAIRVTKAVIPHLRPAGDRPAIVLIGSEGGHVASPGLSAYHASKWGLEGFLESARAELVGFGIDCCMVEPGPMETRFASRMEMTEPLPFYERESVGRRRGAFMSEDRGVLGEQLDVDVAAGGIIDALRGEELPMRIAVGGSVHTKIRRALIERAESLQLILGGEAPS